MNKFELVAAVAIKGEMSKKNAEKVVTAVFDTIEETLAQGEKVQLVNFGTFEVKDRAERQGKNPKTQEPITIPAKKAPAFKAGKGLKDKIKQS